MLLPVVTCQQAATRVWFEILPRGSILDRLYGPLRNSISVAPMMDWTEVFLKILPDQQVVSVAFEMSQSCCSRDDDHGAQRAIVSTE